MDLILHISECTYLFSYMFDIWRCIWLSGRCFPQKTLHRIYSQMQYIYNILYIWEQNVTTYRNQTLPDFVRCDLFINFILHSWPMINFNPWPPVVTCVVREFHQHWVGPTDEARYATGGPDCPMTAGYTSCTCSGSWDVSWFSAIYSNTYDTLT